MQSYGLPMWRGQIAFLFLPSLAVKSTVQGHVEKLANPVQRGSRDCWAGTLRVHVLSAALVLSCIPLFSSACQESYSVLWGESVTE